MALRLDDTCKGGMRVLGRSDDGRFTKESSTRRDYCSPGGRRDDDDCSEEKWVEQAVKVLSVRDCALGLERRVQQRRLVVAIGSKATLARHSLGDRPPAQVKFPGLPNTITITSSLEISIVLFTSALLCFSPVCT